MRYIEIDGITYDIDCCYHCPCYDGGDGGYGETCKHPNGDGESAIDGGCIWPWSKDNPLYGPNCPLREREGIL